MRILALYPAFDASLNEMAMLWEHLGDTRELDCLVLASSKDVLKAHESSEGVEQRGRLSIHRFPALRPAPDILDLGESFRPDMIFCAVTENLLLARAIRRRTGAPIVLHNEYFLDDLTFLRKRYHGGIPPVRAIAGRVGRMYLHRTCASILVSNPVEQRMPAWQEYARLHYLPWPHPRPPASAGRETRDRYFSAHVGSLSRGKGAANLLASYAALLRAQPAFRLRLVGPAVDAEGQHASRTLQHDFPDRVSVQPRCSREEAMDLLRQSLFVFSPARRYGWGLIGDAWGTGTPVLSRTEHYDLRDGINCLVAPDARTFVHHATSLIEDGALFDRIAAGGRETLQGHSLDAVAEVLWNILQQTPRL